MFPTIYMCVCTQAFHELAENERHSAAPHCDVALTPILDPAMYSLDSMK